MNIKKILLLFCFLGNACQSQSQKNDNIAQEKEDDIFKKDRVLVHKLLNSYQQGFQKGDLQRVEGDASRLYVFAEEIYHSHTAQSYLHLTYCNSPENAEKERKKQQKSLDAAKLPGYSTQTQIRSNVVFYVLGKDEKDVKAIEQHFLHFIPADNVVQFDFSHPNAQQMQSLVNSYGDVWLLGKPDWVTWQHEDLIQKRFYMSTHAGKASLTLVFCKTQADAQKIAEVNFPKNSETTQWGLNGAVVFLIQSNDKWLKDAIISHLAGEE
ncbi:MAG: hypothetical protein EAZ55_07875 [Cytophagales bacterium]|nr:MAG: hypothetical protein EAZ55_07875 [Cytophagales bacterium]